MTTPAKPMPRPTAESRPFWDGARQHQLRIQRCTHCSSYIFYPRVLCPACGGIELEWVRASGRGTIYSYTVIRRAALPGFAAEVPYLFAIVELEEGPRMTTNLVGCRPEEVRIGRPVRVCFDEVAPEVTLVKFQLERGAE